MLARGLFEAAQGVVPHPKRDCPIQVLGGALDYARWRKPRFGVTLRRHLRDHQPCPSNIPGRGLRFACAPRSPVATGSDPLSTDLLVAGKASRPAVSQLATTHRRDQAHADEKRARGPASASDSMEPSQVRTRLSAGGKWIRTYGPSQGFRHPSRWRANRRRASERPFLYGGTGGSNPAPSSRQSVSLPQPLSSVKNSGFPRRCARL